VTVNNIKIPTFDPIVSVTDSEISELVDARVRLLGELLELVALDGRHRAEFVDGLARERDKRESLREVEQLNRIRHLAGFDSGVVGGKHAKPVGNRSTVLADLLLQSIPRRNLVLGPRRRPFPFHDRGNRRVNSVVPAVFCTNYGCTTSRDFGTMLFTSGQAW